MKNVIIYLLILPLLLVAAEWQSLNGPPAGRADDLSIGWHVGAEQWHIYAADMRYKLYKSTNGGEYWQVIAVDNPMCVITQPGDAQFVYIGKTDQTPVWWSTNGGEDWEPRSGTWPNNIPYDYIICFAMDPNDNSTMYVGSSEGGVPGICKTTDGGETWTVLENYVESFVTNDIAISPSSAIILAAVEGWQPPDMNGIYRSTDGGNSWDQTITGVDFHSLAFATNDIAYAGAGSFVNKIYKTTNGGANWVLLDNSPNAPTTDFAIISANCVYATTSDGIYLTTDGGTNWELINSGIYGVLQINPIGERFPLTKILVHPDNSDVLFAGHHYSFYKTTDAGEHWSEETKGMKPAKEILIGSNLPYLYSCDRSSCNILLVHQSSDYGTTWSFVKSGSGGWAYSSYNRDIVVTYDDPHYTFAGTYKTVAGTEQSAGSEIWVSEDGFENIIYYHGSGTGYPNQMFTALAADPNATDQVYASFYGWSSTFDVVSKTTDRGETFIPRGSELPTDIRDIIIDPKSTNNVYVGAQSHDKGVWKSTDSGAHWNQIGLNGVSILRLAIDCDRNVLFAGGDENNGIYKTTDDGITWEQKNDGLCVKYVIDLEIDYSEPTVVYSICRPSLYPVASYVYCTVDRGSRWFEFNHGLPSNLVMWDLHIDPHPNTPKCVYLGTNSGIYTLTPDFNKHLVSSVDTATFANNGRNMMRIEGTDEIWVTYESGGVIYVTYTTNAGSSWSKKMELGQGCYPAISYDPNAETPIPGVVWQYYDDTEPSYTIYFSRYTGNNQWSDPVEIISSASTLDPPSLAIGGGNVGHLAYTVGSTVKYTYFSILTPSQTTTASVGTGHNPSIGYLTSTTEPNIHIVWEYDDQIWYRHEPFGLGSPTRVSSSTTDCYHPSLVVEGNVVYFVWEADNDIAWRWVAYNYPFINWGPIKQVCNTAEIPSTYPVLTNGYYCAWTEANSGAFEVYASSYDPQSSAWTTPQNISTGTDEIYSNYPHIVHKQTLFGTTVYFIWTEGTETGAQPTAPPYKIVFTTHGFGDMEEGGGNALPMYIAECGEEGPSPFTKHREGYIHYGIEPYKRIDYDNQYLEYEFTHLNPDMIYTLQAYLYQRGCANLPITINIDGHQFTIPNLPPDSLIIGEHILPDVLCKDGQINLKILGTKAVSAVLVLSEFEHDNKGGGPQGTEGLSGMPDCLTMHTFPCPARDRFFLEYTVPVSGVVQVTLYDAAGRCIQEINNTYCQPGIYYKQMDLTDITQGVYFLRLESNGEVVTRKAIVVR